MCEDLWVLGCDTVYGREEPMFQRTLLFPSSGQSMEAASSLKLSKTTQHHIPDNSSFQSC